MTRFVVAGAGLTGSLLAVRLGSGGHDVTVLERRDDPRVAGGGEGRSINLALSTRGLDALDRVGLAGTVRTAGVAMRGRTIHAPDGTLTHQPYGTNPAEHLLSVDRDALGTLLVEAAAATIGVDIWFETSVTALEPSATADGPLVTVESPTGREGVHADVVVGADGAFSAVRRHLVGAGLVSDEIAELDHGYKELTIHAGPDGDHRMEPDALHIWPRGGHMLIALPNVDGTFTATLFWPFDGAVAFDAVGPGEVADVFARHYPDAAELIGADLTRQYRENPTSRLVAVRCGPWHVDGRVVLVGDAAHAVVPFYGQGANAAMEDVTILCELLATHERSEAFAAFSERRRDTDALAQLALDNFVEMRDSVRSRAFLLGASLRRMAHRVAPRRYVPLYTMVTFTRLPYSQAVAQARRQDRVLFAIALAVVAAVVVLVVAAVT